MEKLSTEYKCKIEVANAQQGPPLSTVLGNFGINTINFCKDFNERTKDLYPGLVVNVVITVRSDRTYSFNVDKPSSSFLLKIARRPDHILVLKSGGLKKQVVENIKFSDIVKVSLMVYGICDNMTLSSLYGTLKSMGLRIDFKS